MFSSLPRVCRIFKFYLRKKKFKGEDDCENHWFCNSGTCFPKQKSRHVADSSPNTLGWILLSRVGPEGPSAKPGSPATLVRADSPGSQPSPFRGLGVLAALPGDSGLCLLAVQEGRNEYLWQRPHDLQSLKLLLSGPSQKKPDYRVRTQGSHRGQGLVQK